MVVSREFVERWVEGWCDSRQMLGRRDGEGWLVEVAAETRSIERVSIRPSPPELDRLVKATVTPDMWLTVIGPLGELGDSSRRLLGSLVAVTHAERMMTADLRSTEMPALVIVEEDGAVAHARVEVDGQLAARGQAAVRGDDVVFDRISVMPEFRRRGLGSRLMAGLTSWATDRGTTTGLLIASPDGQRLYESLGWSEVAPATTFRGPGA